MYEIFGYVPVCVSHTKEYVPYYHSRGLLKDRIPPLATWETEDRYERHATM